MAAQERELLIRRSFDVATELVWLEDLLPKYRDAGLSDAELKKYREAWYEHTERRDWGWWQEHSSRQSNEQLRDEIRKDEDRIERAQPVSQGFKDMLSDAASYAAKDIDEGIDR
jgi:hypothetical protein